jgi:amino acid adenylation domain-containing protein
MLLERFLHWAKVSPEATALVCWEQQVSYGTLLARARAVAEHLGAAGVGPNARVALQLEKSEHAVVALLGVLLTGAAYVPVDPRASTERVARILLDSDPHALIFGAPFLEHLGARAPERILAIPRKFVTQGTYANCHSLDLTVESSLPFAPRPTSPESPAYLLYTSGSTGQPKGVELSHLAARTFVDWAAQCFDIGPTDHLTSFAPLSFDLSIFDLFVSLSTGAKVTLVPPEMLLRPRELTRKLRTWQITTLYAVPSTVQLLVTEGQATSLELPELRRVLYAGEPFPVKRLIGAMRALSRARFYNLFGPTETNVCSYHAFTEPPDDDATDVPIGRACEHLHLELCDENGRPVKAGEPGELCVSGPTVMNGYFRNPDANAQAFMIGETANGTTLRLYRTGDYAKRDSEGRYWFLGRRDRQVKRRGYRIELGELEAALLRYPGVREAATYAERAGDETRIHAVVVPEPGVTVSPLKLRAHCGSTLSPYLVPDSVRIAVNLPRTLTGKLDYQRIGSQNEG